MELTMLVLLIPIALFAAWVVLEYSSRVRMRRVVGGLLGLFAMLAFFIANALLRFDANSYCNLAAYRLLDTSVKQLERGRTEAVLRAWKYANSRIDTGYERLSNFQGIVDQAVSEMEK